MISPSLLFPRALIDPQKSIKVSRADTHLKSLYTHIISSQTQIAVCVCDDRTLNLCFQLSESSSTRLKIERHTALCLSVLAGIITSVIKREHTVFMVGICGVWERVCGDEIINTSPYVCICFNNMTTAQSSTRNEIKSRSWAWGIVGYALIASVQQSSNISIFLCNSFIQTSIRSSHHCCGSHSTYRWMFIHFCPWIQSCLQW